MIHESNDHKNLLAINLSLGVNLLLAALKTTVGLFGGSRALLADGINSTVDVVYLVIVRIFMRLAGEPPDREHPFGHRQMESIAAVVVGAFVMTTAVVIFYDAVDEVYQLWIGKSQFRGAEPVALWVALVTVILKVWLTMLTGRIGRETGSIAVLAVARDHRNDIFSITAAAVGIFLGRSYPWVDPMAAAVVAVLIMYTGITILRESSADLMNVLPSKPVAERIRRLIEVLPDVQQVEEIHAHRIGSHLMVDVTIGIDGNLTVADGDQIANRVEDTLRDNIEFLHRVSVHYHPSRKIE